MGLQSFGGRPWKTAMTDIPGGGVRPGHPPLLSSPTICPCRPPLPSAPTVRQIDWPSIGGQRARTFIRMRLDDVLRIWFSVKTSKVTILEERQPPDDNHVLASNACQAGRWTPVVWDHSLVLWECFIQWEWRWSRRSEEESILLQCLQEASEVQQLVDYATTKIHQKTSLEEVRKVSYVRWCAEKCCQTFDWEDTVRIRRKFHSRSYATKRETGYSILEQLYDLPRNRKKFITLANRDVCENARYIIHGLSRSAFFLYKSVAKTRSISECHGNLGVLWPRAYTIQA